MELTCRTQPFELSLRFMSVLRVVPKQVLRLLDIEVTNFTLDELVAEIGSGVGTRTRRIIANHNLHSVFLFHRMERMRAFYRLAESSHIDGMPLIWIAKLCGFQIERESRITYVDLLPPLLGLADAQRWRIFYVGSKPAACQQGSEVVRARYPGIEWRAAHGYFDVTREGEANRDLVAAIAAFSPDVLLVGMGMPRQEQWIAENFSDLRAGVILPCGAAIDYLAGAVPTPPRWAGSLGLEWLFRLIAEPRRLASRYLVEPWYILGLLLRDRMRRGARATTE